MIIPKDPPVSNTSRFETTSCVVCDRPLDTDVDEIVYQIPGGEIFARFCDEECRRVHQKKVTQSDLPTPYEQIAQHLREIGVDIDSYSNSAIDYSDPEIFKDK